MRRDKTAARILLVLSVVHIAVAAPAVVPQRSLDVTEDVTPTLEKRVKSDDESSVDSFSFPLPPQGSMDPETETKSEESVGSPARVSDPSRYSADPTDIGSDRYYLAPEVLDDEHLTPSSSPSSNSHLTTPVLGAPEFHNDLSPTSGAPQSQDHTSPMSGNPQLHNDPPAGSENLALHDYPSPWWGHPNWRPTGERVQGESSSSQMVSESPEGPPTASKAPQLQDDSSSVSESSQEQDGSPPRPGTSRPPPVHESLGSDTFDSWRWLSDSRPVEGAFSPASSESEGPQRSQRLQMPQMPQTPQIPYTPQTPQGSASAAPTVEMMTANHEVDALKLKIKAYTAIGAILGIGLGFSTGVWAIHPTQSRGTYVSALFLPSRPDI